MGFIKDSVRHLDISDEEYFSKEYSHYISNSRLGLLNPAQGGSIEKFNSGFNDSKTGAFQMGTAVHRLLLEPDTFNLAEVTAPTEAVRRVMDLTYKLTSRESNPLEFDEALTTAVSVCNYYGGRASEKIIQKLIDSGMEYYNYLLKPMSENSIILTPEDKATAIKCVNLVKENERAVELLFPKDDPFFPVEKFSEFAIFIDYDHNGTVVPFKIKVDNWSIDFDNKKLILNDLKTTAYSAKEFMGVRVKRVEYDPKTFMPELKDTMYQGSFQKYHYYRQMYMYLEILKAYVEKTYNILLQGWDIEVNMIVVSKDGFHGTCECYSVNYTWMQIGKQELEYLMELVMPSCCSSPPLERVEDDLSELML